MGEDTVDTRRRRFLIAATTVVGDGGFFCPSHGSRYDLSGRVYKNMPAPLNLPVPPYYFQGKTIVRVGELGDKSDQNRAPKTWYKARKRFRH